MPSPAAMLRDARAKSWSAVRTTFFLVRRRLLLTASAPMRTGQRPLPARAHRPTEHAALATADVRTGSAASVHQVPTSNSDPPERIAWASHCERLPRRGPQDTLRYKYSRVARHAASGPTRPPGYLAARSSGPSRPGRPRLGSGRRGSRPAALPLPQFGGSGRALRPRDGCRVTPGLPARPGIARYKGRTYLMNGVSSPTRSYSRRPGALERCVVQ